MHFFGIRVGLFPAAQKIEWLFISIRDTRFGLWVQIFEASPTGKPHGQLASDNNHSSRVVFAAFKGSVSRIGVFKG
jgi:hypothetical protein